jgi:hypothetical protein
MTNHFIDGSEPKLGHDSTKLVRNVIEEINDMLWGALELLAELGILSGDTDRASVQMASVIYVSV